MSLLEVRNLTVQFGPRERPVIAVEGLDLELDAGEVLGLVGESGSGKSVASLALMGLLAPQARVSADVMRYDGRDLQALSARERRALLGREIAMVFQDPHASLDPCFSVGDQLMETLAAHHGGPRAKLREQALDLLRQVEIPDPEARLKAYPHQLSGGMSQRVGIALAIAGNARLLIADEPTTALDVTVQAQIVALLLRLQRERGMGLILISHDLALVSQLAHRVLVLYAGQEMEQGPVPALFEAPRHPYTEALLRALPEHNRGAARLQALPGNVPAADARPAACLFSPRCPHAQARCHAERPALEGPGDARVRCFFPLADAQRHPLGAPA